MKMALRASSSRKWLALLTAGCIAGIGLQGCSSDNHHSGLSPILTASSPSPVPVGPTLAPVQPGTTTPITTPNFGQITPPPVGPSLPEAPSVAEENGFLVDQPLDSNRYDVEFVDLKVRGTIANVNIQALNITCGTDVTSALIPDAVAQFKSSLIGRGNTFADAGGFNFSFLFPTNPAFFRDGRILSKAIREVVTGFDDEGEPETEDQLTGDDVIIIVTITDSFGQVLRLDDSVFNEDEERFGFPCGSFVF